MIECARNGQTSSKVSIMLINTTAVQEIFKVLRCFLWPYAFISPLLQYLHNVQS